MTNHIVEEVRALLKQGKAVPREVIEDLCDEAEALQDVIDRIAANEARKEAGDQR
jgi:hypothetical protein